MEDNLNYSIASLIDKVARCDPECTEVEVPIDRYNGNVTEDGLIRLVNALKRNPHVRKIDFFFARRTRKLFRGFAALFGAKKKNASVIRRVRLPRDTNNEELSIIVASLVLDKNNRTLEVLDAPDCDIRGRGGGEILETLLLNNGTITEIILGGNENLGAEGLACISRALPNECCVLKRLDLYSCKFGNDGAKELSTGIKDNTVLEELDVRHNRITFTGCRYLLEMLETNTFLKVLILKGNNLNEDRTPGHDETVGDLASRALQRNTSLRDLDLSFCSLSAADMGCVFQTLAEGGHNSNQTLSRLLINNNRMDLATTNELGRLLPDMMGLDKIDFSWCRKGISAPVLRAFLEGLWSNKRLISVEAEYDIFLGGEESRALWRTGSKFVTCRNRMRPLLAERSSRSSGSSSGPSSQAGLLCPARPAVVAPSGFWPYLLNWCNGQKSYRPSFSIEEAKASLIHHVLCARSDDIFCGLATTTTTSKRAAQEE